MRTGRHIACFVLDPKESHNVMSIARIGLTNVRYRPGGLGIVKDASVHALTDYVGWDDSESLVLQGKVAPRGTTGLPEGQVRLNFPIATPVTVSRGGESDGALAPVAGQDDGESGVGKPIRRAIDPNAFWADTRTGEGFTPLGVSSISLDAGKVASTAAVTRASPQTPSSDRLLWVDPEVRRVGTTYTVTDSNLTNSALLRTFLAGLTASAALSLFVLAAEPYLRRRSGYPAF